LLVVPLKGMFIATMYLIRYQSDVLAVPIPAFRKQSGLFDGITQSREIWHSLAVQLIFELITDTVCVVAEARRGLDPVAVWRRLPKAQLLPTFLLMSACATLVGTFRVAFGDNFDACMNKDMCYCVNSGLRPDGVREAYCQLLYPNTSGVPPGTAAAP
jgi:hypothetical protein